MPTSHVSYVLKAATPISSMVLCISRFLLKNIKFTTYETKLQMSFVLPFVMENGTLRQT